MKIWYLELTNPLIVISSISYFSLPQLLLPSYTSKIVHPLHYAFWSFDFLVVCICFLSVFLCKILSTYWNTLQHPKIILSVVCLKHSLVSLVAITNLNIYKVLSPIIFYFMISTILWVLQLLHPFYRWQTWIYRWGFTLCSVLFLLTLSARSKSSEFVWYIICTIQ